MQEQPHVCVVCVCARARAQVRVVCVHVCVQHGRARREHRDTILAESFTATIPHFCESGWKRAPTSLPFLKLSLLA